MNEDKATKYHRLRRRAHALALAANLAFLFALLAGGSIAVRDAAAALMPALGVPRSLIPVAVVAGYVVLVGSVYEILTAPFSFYRGFLLERRFGLSVQPARRWLRDHVTSRLVQAAAALLGTGWLYWVLRRWPDDWWVIAGASVLATWLVLTFVAPVMLLPIFYRFAALKSTALRARLAALAARAGTPVPRAYEWVVGDRTRKANAALIGFGSTRRIVLSDTLLAGYPDDEVEVVVAHELGHHVQGDLWKAMVCEATAAFAGFCFAHYLLGRYGPVIGVESVADVAGFPLLVLAAGVTAFVLAPATHALARTWERSADRFALDATGNPEAFVSLMRRLAAQNLTEARPSRLVQLLFYTHPPVVERIALARQWSDKARSSRRIIPS